jgi:hypothetical protein
MTKRKTGVKLSPEEVMRGRQYTLAYPERLWIGPITNSKKAFSIFGFVLSTRRNFVGESPLPYCLRKPT